MAHLTLDDRKTIEELLKDNKTFTEIGFLIHKHRTSVSDTIIKHRIKQLPNAYGRNLVFCNFKSICTNYHGIGCTKRCYKYKPKEYPKIFTPYVCNGCKKKSGCRFIKYYYRTSKTHKNYLNLLSEARQGIHTSKQEINNIDKIITPLIIEKNQPVNQIYINHPDILCFSKTKFYNLVDSGVFSFRNIDLSRRVKYKIKNNDKKRRTREESIIRIFKTYKDYFKYIEYNKHNNISIVQMDTVEREKVENVFLTLLLVQYNFMFIFLLESKTTKCVSKVFEDLKITLGIDIYKKIFQIILTDNGHEFFAPENIEINLNTGEILSHFFYCDPGASYQKGALEKNHEYIRYILPKGTSFNNLTQNGCDKCLTLKI